MVIKLGEMKVFPGSTTPRRLEGGVSGQIFVARMLMRDLFAVYLTYLLGLAVD